MPCASEFASGCCPRSQPWQDTLQGCARASRRGHGGGANCSGWRWRAGRQRVAARGSHSAGAPVTRPGRACWDAWPHQVRALLESGLSQSSNRFWEDTERPKHPLKRASLEVMQLVAPLSAQYSDCVQRRTKVVAVLIETVSVNHKVKHKFPVWQT